MLFELVAHAGLDQLVLDMMVGPVHLMLFEFFVFAGLELLMEGVMTKVVAGCELPGSSSYIVRPPKQNGLVSLNQVGQRAEVSSRTGVGQNVEFGHEKLQDVGPLALLCSVNIVQRNFF